MPDRSKHTIEALARERQREGILTDFWLFLRQNKKWWLLPLLLIFTLVGAVLILSMTATGPFIYTLF